MALTNQDILDRLKEFKEDTGNRFDRFEKKMESCFDKLNDTLHESQKNHAVFQQEIKTHNKYIEELKEANEKTTNVLTAVSSENKALKKQNTTILKSSKWIIGLLITALIAAYLPVEKYINVQSKPASAAQEHSKQ